MKTIAETETWLRRRRFGARVAFAGSVVLLSAFIAFASDSGQRWLWNWAHKGGAQFDHWRDDDIAMGNGLMPWFCLLPSGLGIGCVAFWLWATTPKSNERSH